MFGFGFQEMAIIFIVGIIVIGPDRLPEVFRFLGRQYGKLMRASQDLRRAFMMEADRADAEYRAEQLKIRREEAKQRLAEQLKRAKEGEDVPISTNNEPYIPFDVDPENDPHLNSDDPLPQEVVVPSPPPNKDEAEDSTTITSESVEEEPTSIPTDADKQPNEPNP